LLGAICLVFLLANLLTSSRSPTVWFDEVMLVDPAANLAAGHGFTSTAWPQPSSQLWAGNAPLYSFLLAGWIRVFGLSPLAVRSFSYFGMVAAALLLWGALVRSRLLPDTVSRLSALAAILCAYGVTFSYRSGRYDALGIAICAFAFWGFFVRRRWLRFALLFLSGFLLPAAGLQLMVYAACMGLLATVFFGRRYLPHFCALAAGIAAGAAALFAILFANGVWSAFVFSTRGIAKLDTVQAAPTDLLPAARVLFSALGQDPSLVVLLCFIAGLLIFDLCSSRRPPSLLLFGLLAALVPMAAFSVSRRSFPIYYSWMAFIPACICACVVVRPRFSRRGRECGAAFVLLAAALVGLPLRLGVTAMEWQQRDYTRVERFVAANVARNEVVYCDFPAYYACQHNAAGSVFQFHVSVLNAAQRARITKLIVHPKVASAVMQSLGGEWQDTGIRLQTSSPNRRWNSFAAALYELAVYRRSAASGSVSPEARSRRSPS